MFQMKFHYDRPAGLRDIYMFESVDARTQARTPARVPSYKLIDSLQLRWAKKKSLFNKSLRNVWSYLSMYIYMLGLLLNRVDRLNL